MPKQHIKALLFYSVVKIYWKWGLSEIYWSDADKSKLELLYKHSDKIKKAHSYALKLTNIFNTHCGRKSGMAKLNRWIKKVEKSTVTCFDGFISTLGKYKAYIVNYFKKRKNSGFVEGMNNKIKVAKRRCYGFSAVKTIFQRLFLDFQGFEIYAWLISTDAQKSHPSVWRSGNE